MRKKLISLDYVLILLVFSMIFIGVVAIGSATRVNSLEFGLNKEFLTSQFMDQLIWVFLGFIAMLFMAFIDYKFICKFYILIYTFNIILLVLVLSPLGSSINDVNRWIFGIQPSEFSKLFMIIFLATYISKNYNEINEPKNLFYLAILILIPFILINKQPSLSASLVLIIIAIFQIFVGNLSSRYIKIILILILPVITILGIDLFFFDGNLILGKILNTYQLNRITSILSFDLTTSDSSLYQTRNSAWAIGSGQFIGKGLFNGSMNQLNYITHSENDFIFAVIGEEFGFIGCFIVILIIFLIVLKCLIIAYKSVDMLGTLLVVGFIGMLSFQVFVNIGVATSLLPNTGMPFPFLSAGGSSMLINMSLIGLVLNIANTKPKKLFKK